jgi:rhodanese-related sulfurtransferase
MLDTRTPADFAKSHIPNSINIGINGSFAPWVGALITDIKQPIVLVTDPGKEEEVVTRLARVGYDNTLGYLNGGMEAWLAAGKEVEVIESISPDEFAKRWKDGQTSEILDARKPTEFLAHHIEGATNFPLDYINKNMRMLSKDSTYYIHCAGGYRSMIMASILQARGIRNIIDVQKGFKGIEENAQIPLTDYKCPTSMTQEELDELVASVS